MNEIFNIKCETGHYRTDPFTFSNLMDNDRTYYYLKGDIGNVRVNRIDSNSNSEFTSRFEDIGKTEKFYLEKINVIHTFENNGIMTIIFCDMMLSILKREMAYDNNIELKLVNIANKDRNEQIVNVYQRVLPAYVLGEIQPENSRIVLENLKNIKHLNLKYYSDIYYLFPLKKRKSDIEYYENLREEKINKLNVNYIKALQTTLY